MATNESTAFADSAEHGVYHFLDVGGQKYGECILVRFGDVNVLIDGSHEKDFDGQEGYDSIPDQLRSVFGREPPFNITLLVVTHGHADHIGCLPKLVDNDVIRPKWALITHPKLGFGRTADDSDAPDLASERTRVLAAALREEDASDLSDAELQEFIDAAASVESKYAAMVDALEQNGVHVIQYQGEAIPQELATVMRPTGMTLLGPSKAQLLFCAEQISTTNKNAAEDVDCALAQDASLDDVALYRAIAGAQDAEDAFRNPRGSGMNCQSITLAFGPPSERVLLSGDMQFAEPGVKGAGGEIKKLRAAVKAAGPYRVFKTTHHTSHNGYDDDLLEELGNPDILVHSGGLRDKDHPWPATLELLKAHRRDITFARTDRNGHITVRPHLPKDQAVEKSRGRFNDFTDNVGDVEEMPARGEQQVIAVEPAGVRGGYARNPQIIIVNLPDGDVDMRVANVEIVRRATVRNVRPDIAARLDDRGRATRGVPPRPGPGAAISVAGGRTLPKLLFVTNSARLGKNIGDDTVAASISAVQAKGHVVCDLAKTGNDGISAVRSTLDRNRDLKGVVILGGYDVVACPAVDVLGSGLRTTLGADAPKDHDNFIVWSDESYGDIDSDKIAEFPVSRIPDARSTKLFLSALQTKGPQDQHRFGVRNVLRPLAEEIWTTDLERCEKFMSDQISASNANSTLQYYMLHGSNEDARVFSGELATGGGYPAGLRIDKVPASFSGVVFSGCCWGALVVSEKAKDSGGGSGSPRVAERSIALTYLNAGGSAFVGCTGSHYSGPDTDPGLNYASILHEAFWDALPKQSLAASPALFAARMAYGKWIAENAAALAPLDMARRLKNRAQFTCLGLGW